MLECFGNENETFELFLGILETNIQALQVAEKKG
jgi:hypothetical protein